MFRVERVAQHASGIVRQQVDRDRRLGRCRPNGMNIAIRRQQGVYIARPQRVDLRNIERRMGVHQIDKLSGYVRYLRENSQELDLLFKELLIGV